MAVGRAAFHVGVLLLTTRLLMGWVSSGAAGLLSPLRGLASSVAFPKYSCSYLARWWCPFLSGDESAFLFGGSFFLPKRGGFAGAFASLVTRSSEVGSGGQRRFFLAGLNLAPKARLGNAQVLRVMAAQKICQISEVHLHSNESKLLGGW